MLELVKPESWKKICLKLLYRSSHQRCSWKKVLLKNFTKFSGKTCVGVYFLIKIQAWGLQLATLFKKETPTKVLFCEFCELFKNIYFKGNFPTTSSFCDSSHSFICKEVWYIFFKLVFFRKIDKNSQFCYLFILQIHFIVYIVNAFYRSKHKHKKSCFVNEIVDLHL